jgi:hypothetical protein
MSSGFAAVIVGINYPDTPRLRLQGCIADAVAVYALICGSDAYLMTDDPHTEPQLRPTAANILRVLREQLASGKTVLLYFSGHGTQQSNTGTDAEADGLDECLVCCDGSRILDDDLRALRESGSHTGDLRCIFDCCHCGTMLDLPVSFHTLETGQPHQYQMRLNHDLATTAGGEWCSLSSCLDAQVSLEADGRGLFTRALLYVVAATGGDAPVAAVMRQIHANTPASQSCVFCCGDVQAFMCKFVQVFPHFWQGCRDSPKKTVDEVIAS